MNTLSNNPPKGTADWLPEEFALRKYIFDTWRKVCVKFGYEEYLTPIVESAEVYRAKSGEDVGGKELMTMTDQAGRELAIRPEMTPSVTRMVTKIYQSAPKPIRLFSIANFIRNEKPQRGRNREFWQLNFDVFGSESINADIEILQMAVEIMTAFGASRNMYKIRVNDRNLLSLLIQNYMQIPASNVPKAVRIIDKYPKVSQEFIIEELENLGATVYEWDDLFELLDGKESGSKFVENYLSKEEKLESLNNMIKAINRQYDVDIEFNPTLARGFDYYDGMVFEVFDKNPENNRAMFGGGRYNGLASIFGQDSFPAVGCAPGDETTKLFLESWNLIPENLKNEVIYIPIIDSRFEKEVQNIAKQLRSRNKNIEVGLEEEKFGKALSYANNKGFSKVILIGENEVKEGAYTLKDMISGQEEKIITKD
jgi:histidyl-tRNA synthetase